MNNPTYFCPCFSVFYPCCNFWWFHELVCKTHRCRYGHYLYASWIQLHILTIHPYRNGKLFKLNVPLTMTPKMFYEKWGKKRVLTPPWWWPTMLTTTIAREKKAEKNRINKTLNWHEFHTNSVCDRCLTMKATSYGYSRWLVAMCPFVCSHSYHCYLSIVWK